MLCEKKSTDVKARVVAAARNHMDGRRRKIRRTENLLIRHRPTERERLNKVSPLPGSYLHVHVDLTNLPWQREQSVAVAKFDYTVYCAESLHFNERKQARAARMNALFSQERNFCVV